MSEAYGAQAGSAVPLHALILEDRKEDVQLILAELRHAGFDPRHEHVDNEKDYGASLDARFDVILADYNLPQFNAVQALRLLQEKELAVPFIVVTGSVSEEAAVACMKNGASDYLLKDRLARLGPAIRLALEGRRMREAKLEAEAQTRRRNRELSLLNRIIAASAKVTDEREFLQATCAEIASALGAFFAACLILDEKSGEPTIVAESRGDGASDAQQSTPPEAWDSLAAMLRGLRAPWVGTDLPANHPVALSQARFPGMRAASVAIAPLTVDGVTVGGLCLFSGNPGHFSVERVALIRSVADEVSSSLARMRLEQERLRLSAAVDQSADAIVIFTLEGTIQYVNAGFELMSGRRRDEVVGRPAKVLTEERPDPFAIRQIVGSLRQGGEWRGKLSARRGNGAPLTVSLSLAPIYDRAGRVINYVMIARDITEALQLEQRFLQAQKMEAIGRLASSVAHDFNNLLTSILGYADLLGEQVGEGGPPAAEVQQIHNAAERAASLTRQLLTFGRKQVLQPQVVSLNTLVMDTRKLLLPMLPKSVALETDLDPQLRPVHADPVQLGQVLMNLAINARDAMPEGGRITVSTANTELRQAQARDIPDGRPGAYVALRVTDTGMGIRADVLPHVFEPFFTTKGEGKGTGLGLAIVFGVVKQSGGHIRVASEVGLGTTFEILLPALRGRSETSSPLSGDQALHGPPSGAGPT